MYHLSVMFHSATQAFEGSFVEWHDLVVLWPSKRESYGI